MALSFLQAPVVASDDDNDVLSVSSCDDDDDDGGFVVDNIGFMIDAIETESDPRPVAPAVGRPIPDQGINTLKASIVSRRVDDHSTAVQSQSDNVTQLQTKKAKKKVTKATQSVQAVDDKRGDDFASLGLSRPLLVNLSKMGLSIPTDVQKIAIPSGLKGHDLLVNAVTGSGKTCAFLLPILERLLQCPNRISLSRVVILSPTRELAAQCFDVADQLCKGTNIRACLVVGGLSMQRQSAALQTRPDIVIATPGRLIDHIRNSQSIHLDTVEILVLDEADRLLELGFVDEVQECINACPKGRQTMLFSATLTAQVTSLADLSLSDPRRISIDAINTLPVDLTQEFVRIRDNSTHTSFAILLALCKRTLKDRTIVFFPSKALAHRALHIFGLASLNAAELHGDLTQIQRIDALEQFRSNRVDFLLCTDLASRGIDIADVGTVLNFSFPSSLSTYVHRVGRTARAGKSGHAITLVTDQSRAILKEILSHSSASVKSRKIGAAVIQHYSDLIESMKDRIAEIEKDEKVEKEIRVAEMSANKMENILIHEREIMNRPKKTWFCSSEEKKRAAGAQAASGIPLKSEKPTHVKKPIVAVSTKPIKEQLKGMTRKQKRRKLQAIEEKKEQESGEKSGPAPDTIMSIASRLEKAKRRITKQQLDDGSSLKAPRNLKRKRPHYEQDQTDNSTFERRYKDVEYKDDKGTGDDQTGKKFKRDRKGSFNSKKKFKRRK